MPLFLDPLLARVSLANSNADLSLPSVPVPGGEFSGSEARPKGMTYILFLIMSLKGSSLFSLRSYEIFDICKDYKSEDRSLTF